jgi:hypothetical protein
MSSKKLCGLKFASQLPGPSKTCFESRDVAKCGWCELGQERTNLAMGENPTSSQHGRITGHETLLTTNFAEEPNG